MKRFYGLLVKSSARLYSSQAASKSKSPLSILRQKTGFPISKCRDALTKHNESVEAAEKWLYSEAQKEGWAKVEKLKERVANQGLIGMLIRRNSNENQAIMVEVNCETDFVARNDMFKDLVSTVTETTFQHKASRLLENTSMPVIDYLSKDLIGSVPASTEQTLADQVAKTVGHLGENISVSRGCTMSATQGLICGFSYNSVSQPDSEVRLGTYGALLHLLPMQLVGGSVNPQSSQELENVGQQVCQHIIGMDVGEVAKGGKDLHSVLLGQNFLFDSSVTVGELLDRYGVTLTKVIIRYALGETDALFR